MSESAKPAPDTPRKSAGRTAATYKPADPRYTFRRNGCYIAAARADKKPVVPKGFSLAPDREPQTDAEFEDGGGEWCYKSCYRCGTRGHGRGGSPPRATCDGCGMQIPVKSSKSGRTWWCFSLCTACWIRERNAEAAAQWEDIWKPAKIAVLEVRV